RTPSPATCGRCAITASCSRRSTAATSPAASTPAATSSTPPPASSGSPTPPPRPRRRSREAAGQPVSETFGHGDRARVSSPSVLRSVQQPVVLEPERALPAGRPCCDPQCDVEPQRQADRRLDPPEAIGERGDHGGLLGDLHELHPPTEYELHHRNRAVPAAHRRVLAVEAQTPRLSRPRVRGQVIFRTVGGDVVRAPQ